MRWFRKLVQVVFVIALGAAASIPFRRLPPPKSSGPTSSDKLVLQNDSPQTVREVPLQIAPAASSTTGTNVVVQDVPPSNESLTSPAEDASTPRTAAHRAAQASRKDLPPWNSKLESNSPPPPLPDQYRDGSDSSPPRSESPSTFDSPNRSTTGPTSNPQPNEGAPTYGSSIEGSTSGSGLGTSSPYNGPN